MLLKEKLLHLAAKASQLRVELEALRKAEIPQGLPAGMSHEMGIALYSLMTVEKKLITLAGKV